MVSFLSKDFVETVPLAKMKKGFYSPYFIVPKCVLNRALHGLPFKMLTVKHMFTCVSYQDSFAAIDLKEACFHVSILPQNKPFL